jgi:hypothetical protein
VHAFVNELERPVGTYLYGRRMYETMRYWESAHTLHDQSPVRPGRRRRRNPGLPDQVRLNLALTEAGISVVSTNGPAA